MIFLWNASAQGIRGRCRERGGRPRFLGRWSSRRELSCQAAVAQNQEEAGPKIRRPDTSGGRKSPTRRVGWTEIADQTRRVRQIAQRLLHVIATDRGSESITRPTRRLELSLLHVIATDRRSESITGPSGPTFGEPTLMSSPQIVDLSQSPDLRLRQSGEPTFMSSPQIGDLSQSLDLAGRKNGGT